MQLSRQRTEFEETQIRIDQAMMDVLKRCGQLAKKNEETAIEDD